VTGAPADLGRLTQRLKLLIERGEVENRSEPITDNPPQQP
jgi:hypothetical protein